MTIFNSGLLKVDDLQVVFESSEGAVRAVNKVSFNMQAKQKVSIIGETGSGKSVLAMTILGLLPSDTIIDGKVLFNGTDLLNLTNNEMSEFRGKDIVLMPQNPVDCLNPVINIGIQVEEAVKRCGIVKKSQRKAKSIELLKMVGLDNASELIHHYPHQLSGGMAQRVLLAIGFAGKPQLVIADEPTRGLDDESKEKYLELVETMCQDCALLLITHDLEVTTVCDEVFVIYAGEIVETGAVDKVLKFPQHPYTRAMLNAQPARGMIPVPGSSPSLSKTIKGCRFYPRCSQAKDNCRNTHPELLIKNGNMVRCFYDIC